MAWGGAPARRRTARLAQPPCCRAAAHPAGTLLLPVPLTAAPLLLPLPLLLQASATMAVGECGIHGVFDRC